MQLAEIEKAVLALGEEEKLRLIADIGHSLAPSTHERSWYREAARRRDALVEGQDHAIPVQEVVEEMKEKFGAP